MNANELADWLQDKTIYLWDSGDEQYYASPICEDIVPMLRQQQEKITKYELRHAVQRDRIAILEAQLKKAQKNG